MIVQERNSQQVEILKADFQHLNDPAFAWGNVVSSFMMLPGLRGFWPMSAVSSTGNALDLSGNGLTLTNNKGIFNHDALAPYVDLTTATSDLNHADTAALDIVATEGYIGRRGLTFGGWYRPNGAIGAAVGLMTKWLATGNQRAYQLRASTTNLEFQFTTDGASTHGLGVPPILTADTWVFCVGRYDPAAGVSGQAITVMRNDTITGVGSSTSNIFNSTATFHIGSVSGANYFNGDAALQFICASALPNYTLLALYHRSRRLFGI